MLACALETEECPSQCRTKPGEPGTSEPGQRPEAKGDLDVAITDKTNSIVSIPSKGIVTFGTLDVSAGRNDDISIYSIDVERIGLGERTDIDRVWLEYNGVRVSGRAGLTSDGKATITFAPTFMVKQNSSEKLELVVSFKDTAAVGAEHAFRITGLDTSAKNVNLSNKETTTFRTTTYKVAELSIQGQGN
jgi:hypothetical protein